MLIQPRPQTSGGLRYEHSQAIPSTTWSVVHNFGRFPFVVSVVDTGGGSVLGSVSHPDNNTTIITFSAAIGGTAYLGA